VFIYGLEPSVQRDITRESACGATQRTTVCARGRCRVASYESGPTRSRGNTILPKSQKKIDNHTSLILLLVLHFSYLSFILVEL
jgi:hypothetical protein